MAGYKPLTAKEKLTNLVRMGQKMSPVYPAVKYGVELSDLLRAIPNLEQLAQGKNEKPWPESPLKETMEGLKPSPEYPLDTIDSLRHYLAGEDESQVYLAPMDRYIEARNKPVKQLLTSLPYEGAKGLEQAGIPAVSGYAKMLGSKPNLHLDQALGGMLYYPPEELHPDDTTAPATPTAIAATLAGAGSGLVNKYRSYRRSKKKWEEMQSPPGKATKATTRK